MLSILLLFLQLILTVCFCGHYFSEPLSYSKTCNVKDYGAKGDGKTNDTLSIQKAINDCYTNYNTSSQVLLPAGGSYLSGPLSLEIATINCGFKIDSNAVLLVSNDRKAWWPPNAEFITIKNQENFIFEGAEGDGGLINGQGQVWWEDTTAFRPHIMDSSHTKGLLIKNINVTFCPEHCLKLSSDYTEVVGLYLYNPGSGAPNTDGIDVHGKPFYVHNSYISTGDDNIAVHENDTLVCDSYFGTGHGASIGSLGDNTWLTNITFNNITFDGTNVGARIKTIPGASLGRLWNVKYTNLNLKNVEETIKINEYYHDNANKTSHLFVDSILYENITSTQTDTDSKDAGSIMCQPSTICKNITMKNVHVSGGGASRGWSCSEAVVTVNDVSPPFSPCPVTQYTNTVDLNKKHSFQL